MNFKYFKKTLCLIAAIGLSGFLTVKYPAAASASKITLKSTVKTKNLGKSGQCNLTFDKASKTLHVKASTTGNHLGKKAFAKAKKRIGSHSYIKIISIDSPIVLPENSKKLFSYERMESDLKEIRGLDKLDTSHVTNMYGMFADDERLGNNSLDLSTWDTSHVTNMAKMFMNIPVEKINVSSFDTSHVTNMYAMFSGCLNVQNFDLHNFNTSQVKNMSFMFEDNEALNSLDLKSFDTGQVTNMSFMFCGDELLENLDLSSFNTSQVKNMSNMFDDDIKLTNFKLGHNFTTDCAKRHQSKKQFSGIKDMFNGVPGYKHKKY
ncbi:BspA family leucine-rich repeat surface protein [Lactobacillus sp. ESL0791]|uniref:BspA family leucine-rich repeat surface protein n=1 Tax=Lactobacillus sp. ESL0791 TaxID=2983234 RepID=UPI0023F8AE29|nr:BspA family leucine-rich repeat surface protein [Lactobacillus sp. ESL0791]MDF7639122.1 BspA family leucine-rich repeat surface protein [Lactobacillus sp. ESL0791]